ncbi:MAG: 4-hydroxy-tetrahydrodipicolinate synthase [Bacteroidota bacterium]
MQKGAYTLLITPFKPDMSLDVEGLRRLVKLQLDAGVDGIAPLGVTGENTLLNIKEIELVVKTIVETAAGKAKIVPETCVSSLWEAKERAKLYADLGADYISVFSPFFVMPKEEGVLDFYEKLADFSKLPIILHNAKERTGVEITPQMSAKLAKHPNIIGIKDGNKGLDHLAKVIYLTKDNDFEVFTGKDTTAFPTVLIGGAGSFTVAGNAIPKVMTEMLHLVLEGKTEEARQIHYDYYNLYEAFRFETNPMAAKMALKLMGLPCGALRAPLTELSEAKTLVLKKLMQEKNLI